MTGRGFPGRSVSVALVAAMAASQDDLVAAAVARSGGAPLLEALPAVDRLVIPRLEGDFRLLATGRANGRVHLARPGGITAAAATTGGVTTATRVATTAARGVTPRGAATVVAASGSLGFALRPATGATLRLRITALCVERLLPSGKSEFLAAIATGDRLIQLAETSLAVV